jgi:hypothetical protein
MQAQKKTRELASEQILMTIASDTDTELMLRLPGDPADLLPDRLDFASARFASLAGRF